ncbi:MAG: hypothetical protein ACRCX2_36345 [Paraclostridium sp.]
MRTKNRIIGLDFFKTKPDASMKVSVVKIGTVGLESNEIVRGNNVYLKNITAAQYRDLLNGLSYLEFWIEAIDHSKPTANNRLYSQDEFAKGMDRVLRRVIDNGGLQPGEHEHPPIEYDSNLSEKDNMTKISGRLMRFDQSKITHYIVDTKTEDGKTFFKIRTNPSYPIIVKEIALGKVPTFSIRTLGDFPLINGVNVGQNLLVITTDYVYNPANRDSRPIATNMKFVDPVNATAVDVSLEAKVGNESVELFKLKSSERLIIGVEADNSITLNIVETVKELSKDQLASRIFSEMF